MAAAFLLEWWVFKHAVVEQVAAHSHEQPLFVLPVIFALGGVAVNLLILAADAPPSVDILVILFGAAFGLVAGILLDILAVLRSHAELSTQLDALPEDARAAVIASLGIVEDILSRDEKAQELLKVQM